MIPVSTPIKNPSRPLLVELPGTLSPLLDTTPPLFLIPSIIILIEVYTNANPTTTLSNAMFFVRYIKSTEPSTAPRVPLKVITLAVEKSTFFILICAIAPEIAVTITAVIVVPIAQGREYLNRKYNAGNIIEHPPIPKSPPTTPATTPNKSIITDETNSIASPEFKIKTRIYNLGFKKKLCESMRYKSRASQSKKQRTLSERDLAFIKALENNCKVNYKRVARILSISHTAARKRTEKLVSNKYISIIPALNLKRLGFILVLLFLEVASEEYINKLLEKFKECPRIIFIFKVIGEYNLAALIYAEDDKVLDSILGTCMLRVSEGIRKSEVMLIPKILINEYYNLRIPIGEREKAPCGADCYNCEKLRSNECIGCPSVKYYNGWFSLKSMGKFKPNEEIKKEINP